MSDERWLVVGLGNPGSTYAHTRHNVGAMVADELAARSGAGWKTHRRGGAAVVETRFGASPGTPVVLAKPHSYMNRSGAAVAALVRYYDVPAERTVLVHDELDLPFGGLRLKRGGGDNGHNGLVSVRSTLGTGDFVRVRVGIDRPPGRMAPADHVLRPFSTTERRDLAVEVGAAADAVETLVSKGLAAAQNAHNR